MFGTFKLSFDEDILAYFGYRILSSIAHTFYIENDAEIFPAHFTWKEAEKRFKVAFMMNKLAMNNSCEIIVEK
jgi:hypothetical protein